MPDPTEAALLALWRAFYEEHVALGDGDMWGCPDTILGDYCRTCYEASDAYEDGEEPPLLTHAGARPMDEGE